MRYRVNFICKVAGHIDFEVNDREELNWQVSEINYPEQERDFYEEDRETEIELIERLVPEMVVEVRRNGDISFRSLAYSSHLYKWMPEYDKVYMNSVIIKQCFCILPGGDV